MAPKSNRKPLNNNLIKNVQDRAAAMMGNGNARTTTPSTPEVASFSKAPAAEKIASFFQATSAATEVRIVPDLTKIQDHFDLPPKFQGLSGGELKSALAGDIASSDEGIKKTALVAVEILKLRQARPSLFNPNLSAPTMTFNGQVIPLSWTYKAEQNALGINATPGELKSLGMAIARASGVWSFYQGQRPVMAGIGRNGWANKPSAEIKIVDGNGVVVKTYAVFEDGKAATVVQSTYADKNLQPWYWQNVGEPATLTGKLIAALNPVAPRPIYVALQGLEVEVVDLYISHHVCKETIAILCGGAFVSKSVLDAYGFEAPVATPVITPASDPLAGINFG